MRVKDQELLVSQAERFALACSCEECVHFAMREARCSLGYPTRDHRRNALSARAFVFCKMFEVE